MEMAVNSRVLKWRRLRENKNLVITVIVENIKLQHHFILL